MSVYIFAHLSYNYFMSEGKTETPGLLRKARETTVAHLPARLKELRTLDEEGARSAFRKQIEASKRRTGRFDLFWQEEDKPVFVYEGEKRVGKVPAELAERILWEEMTRFGVDPTAGYPENKDVGGFDSQGVSRSSDGSTVEIIKFLGHEPDTTEQGTPTTSNLEFIRSRYTGGDGKNQHYYWQVERDSPETGVQYA